MEHPDGAACMEPEPYKVPWGPRRISTRSTSYRLGSITTLPDWETAGGESGNFVEVEADGRGRAAVRGEAARLVPRSSRRSRSASRARARHARCPGIVVSPAAASWSPLKRRNADRRVLNGRGVALGGGDGDLGETGILGRRGRGGRRG